MELSIRCLKIIFKLIKAKYFGRKFPLIIGWALTNRCNIKCKYCNRWMQEDEDEEMSTEEVLTTISSLAKMGAYKINFTGGEPLLREDLDEIIKWSVENNIKVAINTNGSLVPVKIHILKNIDVLGLSLDGPEEIHDSLRYKGSYKDILRAVKVAKYNGIKVIFNTLINRMNIKCLNNVLDIAQSLQTKVIFSLIDFIPFASKEIELLIPPRQDYYQAIDKLIKEKENDNKIIFNSLSGLQFFKNWPNSKEPKGCIAGLIYCRIEPNGYVYNCGRIITEEASISCKQDSFKKIFLNLKRQDPCQTCWCGNKIEMNQIFSLKWDSILNMLNFEFKKR